LREVWAKPTCSFIISQLKSQSRSKRAFFNFRHLMYDDIYCLSVWLSMGGRGGPPGREKFFYMDEIGMRCNHRQERKQFGRKWLRKLLAFSRRKCWCWIQGVWSLRRKRSYLRHLEPQASFLGFYFAKAPKQAKQELRSCF